MHGKKKQTRQRILGDGSVGVVHTKPPKNDGEKNAPHVVRVQRHLFRVRGQEAQGQPSLHERVANRRVEVVAGPPRESSHRPGEAEDGSLLEREGGSGSPQQRVRTCGALAVARISGPGPKRGCLCAVFWVYVLPVQRCEQDGLVEDSGDVLRVGERPKQSEAGGRKEGTHPRISVELHHQSPQLVPGYSNSELDGSPVTRRVRRLLRYHLRLRQATTGDHVRTPCRPRCVSQALA